MRSAVIRYCSFLNMQNWYNVFITCVPRHEYLRYAHIGTVLVWASFMNHPFKGIMNSVWQCQT